MSEHVLAGLVGGLAGTVAMTIPMLLMMGDQPSAPQVVMSKVNRKPPEENLVAGMVLHFLYGIVAGLVLTVLVEALWQPVADFGTLGFTFVGAGYGVLLWLGSFFWMAILGTMESLQQMGGGEKATMMAGMLGMHVIYGAVAGVVVVLLA